MNYRKQSLRVLFFVFLLACLLTGLAGITRAPARAAPQMQAATNVVISEFRSRGSAGGNDEFIELYNPTANPIDITGWKINSWSPTSGNTSTRVTIPAVILQPGQHYLIANNNAGGPYSGSVQANLTYGTGFNDSGGIALLRADDTIVDAVGMNTSSTYLEGTPLIPLTGTSDQSYERKLGSLSDSCQDTSDNSNDFTNISPSAPQNLASPLSLCGTILPTLTPTSTPTNTGTPTATGTTTNTPTNTSPAPVASIVISEFRTLGPNGGNDEFIELYNPTGSSISIAGWTINRSSGCGMTVNLAATIPPGITLASGQHYLIGGSAYSGSVVPNLPNISLNIADNGGIALLNGSTIVDQVGLCATTLYREGTALTQLTTNVNRGYDRKASSSGICVDTNNNAADFFLRSPSDPQNLSSPLTICGNPTPTPIPSTSTPRPTATWTPTPLPPPPLIAINEFVPRPGHDWNGDGMVNVDDEYIELLNHGVIDVDLSGYSLDDEVNIGSNPYLLPAVVIKPGERLVFFGSETGLLLSDGGDGVRLLKPNGELGDAYNYRVVRHPDHTYCRYPDNGGADDWNTNCFPTPGLQNALSGSFTPPQDEDGAPVESLCPLSDTQPNDFIWAECQPFGQNIFRPAYWDKTGWFGEKYLPESPGKWPVFVD